EPSQGLPYGGSHDDDYTDVGTWDASRVVVGFGERGLRLEAGQDWNRGGPGRWQQATLGPRPHFWVADSLPPGVPGSATGFNGNEDFFMRARRGYRYAGEGPPMAQIRFRTGGANWEYVKIVAQRTGLSK